MKLHSVYDEMFCQYGTVLEDYDFTELCSVLAKQEKPSEGILYLPSCQALEECSVSIALSCSCFGGMPIQIGFCNGSNTILNCLEYHKTSEVNLALDEVILLVGRQQDIDLRTQTYDTSGVEAFLLPAGTAVELYATTLHFAPCNGIEDRGFRVAVALPLGTNEATTRKPSHRREDRLLTAQNKWLLAHPEAAEAEITTGRLIGENWNTKGLLHT